MSYSSLWLYKLMKEELTGPKSVLKFALDLAEKRGCSEVVHGEAGGCSVQLRARELSLGALRHTGRPWLSKSFKIAQLEQVNSPVVGLLCALGYASAKVFCWIGALISQYRFILSLKW